MTHNPLPNHGIKLTYHGILKDAVLKSMEYINFVSRITLKYLHSQKLQIFISS